MTRTFQRHMAELDTGFYGPGFIKGYVRALTRLARVEAGYSVSRAFGGMTAAELDKLTDRIWTECPHIVPEQAEKAVAWLRKLCLRKDGAPRESCPLGSRELNVLRHFDHFEFRGARDPDLTSGYIRYVPMYRVVASDYASRFTYSYGSWQCGSALEVVE